MTLNGRGMRNRIHRVISQY